MTSLFLPITEHGPGPAAGLQEAEPAAAPAQGRAHLVQLLRGRRVALLEQGTRRPRTRPRRIRPHGQAGTNYIKIGLPGKLILSKRKELLVVLFS